MATNFPAAILILTLCGHCNGHVNSSSTDLDDVGMMQLKLKGTRNDAVSSLGAYQDKEAGYEVFKTGQVCEKSNRLMNDWTEDLPGSGGGNEASNCAKSCTSVTGCKFFSWFHVPQASTGRHWCNLYKTCNSPSSESKADSYLMQVAATTPPAPATTTQMAYAQGADSGAGASGSTEGEGSATGGGPGFGTGAGAGSESAGAGAVARAGSTEGEVPAADAGPGFGAGAGSGAGSEGAGSSESEGSAAGAGAGAGAGIIPGPGEDTNCDWQCYLDRYTVLKAGWCKAGVCDLDRAKRHYEEIGKAKGQDCTCRKTDYSACNWQCYFDRYPNLMKVLGKNNYKGAQKHYDQFGYNEGRDCTCPTTTTTTQEPQCRATGAMCPSDYPYSYNEYGTGTGCCAVKPLKGLSGCPGSADMCSSPPCGDYYAAFCPSDYPYSYKEYGTGTGCCAVKPLKDRSGCPGSADMCSSPPCGDCQSSCPSIYPYSFDYSRPGDADGCCAVKPLKDRSGCPGSGDMCSRPPCGDYQA